MSGSAPASPWFAAPALVWFALVGPAKAGALDPYLPKSGTISGHVVTFSITPTDQAIARRFRQAVQDNLEFFKQAVSANARGAALPYDKRMGVADVQYDRLLHLRPAVTQVAEVMVTVLKQPDGRIGFKPADAASTALADVTFAPDEKVAQTPFGALAVFNEIHQRDETAPLGMWDGAEWAQVMPPGSDTPSAKIAFGKRAADGQGVLYYQVAPHKDEGEQSLVVFYKLD